VTERRPARGSRTPVIEDEQLYPAERPQETGPIATIAAGRGRGRRTAWECAGRETERLSRTGFVGRGLTRANSCRRPVGPHRIKFSWASIQLPSASFWNNARSSPRAGTVIDILDGSLMAQIWHSAGAPSVDFRFEEEFEAHRAKSPTTM